jgi:hypothetical protein
MRCEEADRIAASHDAMHQIGSKADKTAGNIGENRKKQRSDRVFTKTNIRAPPTEV